MIQEDCGHFVRPLYDPVYTVMLSSKVIWPNNAEKADKHLKPLSDERKEEIKNIFKEYYVEFFT